ncbi:hypothetical protein HY857_01390 [Candidatus Saccharibacteria bacterium]|nr:hypothetical protein [Candidatus Saccharibacteria bacterium]
MADQPENEQAPIKEESGSKVADVLGTVAKARWIWWLVGIMGFPLLAVLASFVTIVVIVAATGGVDGSGVACASPLSTSSTPTTTTTNLKGQLVQASVYGGPSDPSSGYTGAYGSLVGNAAFAELSTHPENPTPAGWDFSALGGLPAHARLRVTNPATHVTLVMEKLDVGRGGASHPKIDLWYEAAAVLGFHGIGKVVIAPAQPGDVPSLKPLSSVKADGSPAPDLSLDCSVNGQATGPVQDMIVKETLKYALPDHHTPPYFVMDGDYSKAVEEALKRGEWVGGGIHPGIDCGGFVTRVMRDSGVDPNYNAYQGIVTAQQKYMDDHSELYKRLGSYTSDSELKAKAHPGDIAINSVHTYIYVKDQPGFHGDSASASFSTTGFSWRTPMASDAYLYSNSTIPFVWYRYIGQPGGKP